MAAPATKVQNKEKLDMIRIQGIPIVAARLAAIYTLTTATGTIVGGKRAAPEEMVTAAAGTTGGRRSRTQAKAAA
jgi:hypothetical protein